MTVNSCNTLPAVSLDQALIIEAGFLVLVEVFGKEGGGEVVVRTPLMRHEFVVAFVEAMDPPAQNLRCADGGVPGCD